MDALLKYYEKNSIYVNLYKDKYEALKKIKKYLPDSDDVKIYISNFYELNVEETVYIFGNDRMLEVSFEIKDSSLTTSCRVMKFSDLKSYQFVEDTGYRAETKLLLEFSDRRFLLSNYIENYEELENEENEEAEEKKKAINSKILEGIFEHLLKRA